MKYKLTRYKKNKLSKTQKVVISCILIILTIGVGYSALVTNLSIIGNLVVKEYDDPNLFNKMVNLSKKTDSCITKYEGQVTDEVNNTVNATNVYFNKCSNKRNIIFNNMCWQVIRTTETGGIKMLYNGEAVDGKCLNTRVNHKGIVGTSGSTQNLASNYLYGTTFTYNTATSEFTLVDTSTATWSDSTYQNLLGKFTCMDTDGICTTLYSVNGYSNATTAYTSSYTIGDTNYAQIGTSAYNANYRSPAMVGYMFNKVYNYVANSAPTSGSLMGNDVSYSGGTYTLLPADGESSLGTTKDATHHYTCNSTTLSTCSIVRYYYQDNFYIELSGGTNIETALNEMLYNNDVNTYNSSIKGIIDSWYKQKIDNKTIMLENTVYCNARNTKTIGGWNPNGESITLQFKNFELDNDLKCVNETDQFSKINEKAKLTYPVGLASHEEIYSLTGNNNNSLYGALVKTGSWWWGLSPYDFFKTDAEVNFVGSDGYVQYTTSEVYHVGGVRPVISLKNDTIISSGTGSESEPWVVQE